MAKALRVLILEILLFTLAAFSALIVFKSLPRAATLPVPSEINLPASEFVANPATDPIRHRLALETSLKRGDLVIFGSSELTLPSDAAVQKFLPKACGRRVMAIGQAGFQSLPILFHLAQARKSLGPQSKVVIITSPVWFAERGTSSQSLLKFMEPFAIPNLVRDEELPSEVRASLARAVRVRGDELTGLYPDWLINRFPVLAQWTRDRRPDLSGVKVNVEAAAPVSNFNWDEAEQFWLKKNKSDSDGNPFGVTAEFYHKVKKHNPPYPFKTQDSWQVEKQDILALSSLLHHYGVRAHFILQPVHRRIYNHLEPYDELFREISAKIEADGHHWESWFSEPFDLTALSDAAHFSDSAWIRLEKEFCSL